MKLHQNKCLGKKSSEQSSQLSTEAIAMATRPSSTTSRDPQSNPIENVLVDPNVASQEGDIPQDISSEVKKAYE